MKVNVIGVKIDDVSMDEVINLVDGWLKKDGSHYIVTPNPEFLMTAQKDEEFKLILNNADLAIPDGVGLKLAGVKNTIAGVDLMEKLVKLSEEKAFTIGLLGGSDRVAELCVERLKKKYPGLKISFADSGGEVDNEGRLLKSLRIPNLDLLFVAFGHPKQEFWISENLNKIPVKVAMGVGGAFDYISGKVPRAPIWIRKLGMEWFFRLIIQPWRIKRQVNLLRYIWLLTK